MYKPAFVGLATLLCGCAGMRGAPPASERGGFVATLGADTVQIERFEQAGRTIRGTVVTRIPMTRVIQWTMSLDAKGGPERFTMETRDVNGMLLTHNWSSGSFTYVGDTIS